MEQINKLRVVHFLLHLQFWFPVWIVFLQSRGISLGWIIAADALFRITIVCVEFPLGVLSDRIGRKRTYLLSTILAALTFICMAMVQGVPLLLVCWVLWALFLALASGSDTAYWYEAIVSAGKSASVTRHFGVFRAIECAAILLSNLLAGWLYEITAVLPILLNALAAALAIFVVLTLPDQPDKKEMGPPISATVRLTLRQCRRNPELWGTLMMISVLTAYYWTATFLFQPLLTELEVQPSLFGAYYLGFAVGGMMAGSIVGHVSERFGSGKTVTIGISIMLFSVALMALKSQFAAIVGISLIGFGHLLAVPVLRVALHTRISDWRRATLVSFASLLGSVWMVFTRPAIGVIAETTSVPFAYLFWCAMGVVVIVVLRRLWTSVA